MAKLCFFFASLLLVAGCAAWSCCASALSSKLVHRFSDEARAVAASRGDDGRWPARGSNEYYEMLARRDLRRQRRRLESRHQTLFPAEGSETFSLGNDFGWLHYTWIDIGTPNVSFLVALDAGSDLLWVPCDCIQCAPLSGYRNSLDKDLGMYSPMQSTTSKHVFCSHELCTSGPNCNNPKQPCPYHIDYYSENTSSSGSLVEDILYLGSTEEHASVQASVIIGCGRRQSGGYLDGIAPDGLLGLGLGDISVPSFLARAGLVQNSFSMCFQNDDSGRIFFGDKSFSSEQATPFVPLDGKYITYIVAVDSFCIGLQCLVKTSFQTLVDSGSSFTFLPNDVYKRVTSEFDRQINVSRLGTNESPFDYCYKASPLGMPVVPELTLVFAGNSSFVALDPIFPLYDKGAISGFCLAVQSTEENYGTIGQNLMTGYRMVFDRENLKLGWAQSDCSNLENTKSLPLTPPPQDRPENPLPTNEQQSSPNGHAVSPAVAGRAPTTSSSAVRLVIDAWYFLLLLLNLHTVIHIG